MSEWWLMFWRNHLLLITCGNDLPKCTFLNSQTKWYQSIPLFPSIMMLMILIVLWQIRFRHQLICEGEWLPPAYTTSDRLQEGWRCGRNMRCIWRNGMKWRWMLETQEAKRLLRPSGTSRRCQVEIANGKRKGKERRRMRLSSWKSREGRRIEEERRLFVGKAFWTHSSSSGSSLQLFQRYHRQSLTNFKRSIGNHDHCSGNTGG